MIRHVISKIRRGLRSLSRRQRGQSLVELAIVTPILLLLLLGLSEVGAALRSYIVVVNAAREGARYGSKDEFIPDSAIVDWVQQSGNTIPMSIDLGGTGLEVDEAKATVIVTRLKQTYDAVEGYGYEIESQYCEGGCGAVGRASILTPVWLDDRANITENLNWPGGVPQIDMDLIAVEVMYDHPQITGLFTISRYVPDPVPLHGITIMRLGGNRIPRCDSYPIAVHEDTLAGKEEWDLLGDIWNGLGTGQFGWLRWPEDTSNNNANYLKECLEDPRRSRNEYDNACDSDDHWLNVGDCVYGNTGTVSASFVKDALDDLLGKKIRVLVWDWSDSTGSGAYYHIVGYVWVEITDYDLDAGWIEATFRGWDQTCSASATH